MVVVSAATIALIAGAWLDLDIATVALIAGGLLAGVAGVAGVMLRHQRTHRRR